MDINNINGGVTQEDLRDSFRKVLQNLANWTRILIISGIYNIGDFQIVYDYILKTIKEITDIVAKYYGTDFAEQLKTIMEENLAITADLIGHIKNNEINEINTGKIKWQGNARTMGQLFASVNPYWTADKWYKILNNYLESIIKLSTSRKNSQYESTIQDVVNNENSAIEIADYFAEGVYNQYFSKPAFKYY